MNDPPVITSDGGNATLQIDENTTAVTTVTATDADAVHTLSYALTGGADKDLFSIDSKSGVLTFNNAPDFETPTDANHDGKYLVTVQVTMTKVPLTRKTSPSQWQMSLARILSATAPPTTS